MIDSTSLTSGINIEFDSTRPRISILSGGILNVGKNNVIGYVDPVAVNPVGSIDLATTRRPTSTRKPASWSRATTACNTCKSAAQSIDRRLVLARLPVLRQQHRRAWAGRNAARPKLGAQLRTERQPGSDPHGSLPMNLASLANGARLEGGSGIAAANIGFGNVDVSLGNGKSSRSRSSVLWPADACRNCPSIRRKPVARSPSICPFRRPTAAA